MTRTSFQNSHPPSPTMVTQTTTARTFAATMSDTAAIAMVMPRMTSKPSTAQ